MSSSIFPMKNRISAADRCRHLSNFARLALSGRDRRCRSRTDLDTTVSRGPWRVDSKAWTMPRAKWRPQSRPAQRQTVCKGPLTRRTFDACGCSRSVHSRTKRKSSNFLHRTCLPHPTHQKHVVWMSLKGLKGSFTLVVGRCNSHSELPRCGYK